MSFSCQLTARSRAHALQQLEQQTHLPSAVRSFLETAVRNIPVARDATRVILIKAHGHLCERDGDYAVSSASIEVTPIDVPD